MRRKMTKEEKAARKAARAERARERMAGVSHRLFGSLSPVPVPGTVFDPLAYLTCPGRYRDVKWYFRYRARRAGVGAGQPRVIREALLDEAAEHGMDFMIHRDYEAAGFDADACGPAVLSAARWMDRAYWRPIDAERRGDYSPVHPGDFILFNRAQTARAAGDNPAACVSAAESMGTVWTEVFPVAHEIPGTAVALPGGPSGRGATDGKMVRDGGRIKWRMKRGRGRAHNYEPGIVRDSIPAPAPRYVPGPMPTERPAVVWRPLPGPAVQFAADPEVFRAARQPEPEPDWQAAAAEYAAVVQRAREFAARRD